MTKSDIGFDRGGGVGYSAPAFRIISVKAEKGFASSPDSEYDWTDGILNDDDWNHVGY